MINVQQAHKYCKDDISKIENYEKAIMDTAKTWDLHHRDEIRVLPSGMKVYRSMQELIENGRYYLCPANELIFLTHAEHQRLHVTGTTGTMKGKLHSADAIKKMSIAHVGKNNAMYGKHQSKETKAKIREAALRREARKRGIYDVS